MIGRRFGSLVVIGDADYRINAGSMLVCRCDCGLFCVSGAERLTSGGKTQCLVCEKREFESITDADRERRRVEARERQAAVVAQRDFNNRARRTMVAAILKGTLVRARACSKCATEGPVEGHHEDYSKPLEVVWLCTRCHKLLHSAQRRALRQVAS